MVRISGYGQSGPYSQRPGFAAIAECMGGLRHVTGFADRPPVRVGVSLGDTLASLYGTIGALVAMPHLKANAGKGRSEEHTSELQSLIRNSYAVFCLKKK